MPGPFDPLRALAALHAIPSLGPGGIELRFDGRVEPHNKRKAWAVVKAYERLLTLQLENGGVSVRKLLARGTIRIEGGRFRLG